LYVVPVAGCPFALPFRLNPFGWIAVCPFLPFGLYPHTFTFCCCCCVVVVDLRWFSVTVAPWLDLHTHTYTHPSWFGLCLYTVLGPLWLFIFPTPLHLHTLPHTHCNGYTYMVIWLHALWLHSLWLRLFGLFVATHTLHTHTHVPHTHVCCPLLHTLHLPIRIWLRFIWLLRCTRFSQLHTFAGRWITLVCRWVDLRLPRCVTRLCGYVAVGRLFDCTLPVAFPLPDVTFTLVCRLVGFTGPHIYPFGCPLLWITHTHFYTYTQVGPHPHTHTYTCLGYTFPFYTHITHVDWIPGLDLDFVVGLPCPGCSWIWLLRWLHTPLLYLHTLPHLYIYPLPTPTHTHTLGSFGLQLHTHTLPHIWLVLVPLYTVTVG